MDRFTAPSETSFKKLSEHLGKEGILKSESVLAKENVPSFVSDLVGHEDTVTLFRIKFEEESPRPVPRILQESNTTTANTTSTANGNKIYIKPDALFGIMLSLFVGFITFVGVMCLYGVKTPQHVPSKPFRFGREM